MASRILEQDVLTLVEKAQKEVELAREACKRNFKKQIDFNDFVKQ